MGLAPQNIFMISSSTGLGVSALYADLDHRRKQRNVYVVGCSNVGKSTFINKLIQVRDGRDLDVIIMGFA